MGELSMTRGSTTTAASSSIVRCHRLCRCGEEALMLTSKTRSNPGRKFFRCPNFKEAWSCGFFEWADESVKQRENELVVEQKALIKSLENAVKTLKLLLILS